MAGYFGITVSILSFICLIIILYKELFTAIAVPGGTLLLVACLLMNGLILIVLGIIGEYIGRIYDESKRRPLYIIKEKEGFDSAAKDRGND